MLIDLQFDEFFRNTIRFLKPYLGDLVCIGGCANALYRHHQLASPTNMAYIGTKDIDLASELKLPVRGKPVSQLMTEAGLREEHLGSGSEAVIKYCPANEDLAMDVEFLCPASGVRGTSRGREHPESIDVQIGLKAQPLRYLDLLIHSPWQISLERVPGFTDFREIAIQVPNPAAYVIQKVLIRQERRKPESMAKDCYYIFEVSVQFRDAFDRLGEDFSTLAAKFPPKWIRTFQKEAAQLFRDENAEGPVSAMKIFRNLSAAGFDGYRPTEKIIAEVVSKLLKGMKS